jgi:hypothetical protein
LPADDYPAQTSADQKALKTRSRTVCRQIKPSIATRNRRSALIVPAFDFGF